VKDIPIESGEVAMVLVGNKSDLVAEREVSE
jgi:GTPase SAR1 family protein